MEKRIPVQQFDLQRFIEETRAFIKGRLTAEIDPSCEIPAIGEDDSVFEWDPKCTGRDLARELTQEGKTLFFPFSADSGSRSLLGIRCADGSYHSFRLSKDCFQPVAEEEDSEHCVTVGYRLSAYDFVGFIVSSDQDGMLLFQEGTLFTKGENPCCYPVAERKSRYPLFVDEAALEAFLETFCTQAN